MAGRTRGSAKYARLFEDDTQPPTPKLKDADKNTHSLGQRLLAARDAPTSPRKRKKAAPRHRRLMDNDEIDDPEPPPKRVEYQSIAPVFENSRRRLYGGQISQTHPRQRSLAQSPRRNSSIMTGVKDSYTHLGVSLYAAIVRQLEQTQKDLTGKSNRAIKARRENLSRQEDISDQLHKSLLDLNVELSKDDEQGGRDVTIVHMGTALKEFKDETRNAVHELSGLCETLKSSQHEIYALQNASRDAKAASAEDEDCDSVPSSENGTAQLARGLEEIREKAIREMSDTEKTFINNLRSATRRLALSLATQ